MNLLKFYKIIKGTRFQPDVFLLSIGDNSFVFGQIMPNDFGFYQGLSVVHPSYRPGTRLYFINLVDPTSDDR